MDNNIKGGRIHYIDYLKSIALCAIVIAHVAAPNVISQLRNFDVILMVICSGLLARNSTKKFKKGYGEYFISRIKRLIIPTWAFLIVYFLFSYLIGQKQDFMVIVDTFLFQHTGIGYTWIILVYLICALSLPIVSKINANPWGMTFWGVLLLLQEIICKCEFITTNHYLESICCYIVPYVFAYWCGYWFEIMSKSIRNGIVGGSFIIVLSCAVAMIYSDKSILTISAYKFPPRLYYWSYGILIGCLLLVLFKNLKISQESRLVAFISRWSLWIYLWHIIPVKIAERVFIGNNLWIVRFIFVVVVTSIIMLFWCNLVGIIQKQCTDKTDLIKYMKG